MAYYIAAAIVCQWNPNCKRLLITNYNQLEDRLCSMLANKEPLVALGALVRRDNPHINYAVVLERIPPKTRRV